MPRKVFLLFFLMVFVPGLTPFITRWHNHLNPDIKKGQWTVEEEKIIQEKQAQLGNKWAEIAKYLEGRFFFSFSSFPFFLHPSLRTKTFKLSFLAQSSVATDKDYQDY